MTELIGAAGASEVVPEFAAEATAEAAVESVV